MDGCLSWVTVAPFLHFPNLQCFLRKATKCWRGKEDQAELRDNKLKETDKSLSPKRENTPKHSSRLKNGGMLKCIAKPTLLHTGDHDHTTQTQQTKM